MNKERRERIEDVVQMLNDAADELDEIREEEAEAYDDMPESLQGSTRGEKMNDAIDAMGNLYSEIVRLANEIESWCRKC